PLLLYYFSQHLPSPTSTLFPYTTLFRSGRVRSAVQCASIWVRLEWNVPILPFARITFMSIVENRKATHDYFIEERFEAGLVLEGWEVKAIRAGHVQRKESYIIVRNGEIFIIGMHVSPLPTASTHVRPEATRTRKLLLHADEIKKLIGKTEQRGYTLVPLNLHYRNGRIKLDFGLGRGKKLHDKRDSARDRDWAREKERLLKHDIRNKRTGY